MRKRRIARLAVVGLVFVCVAASSALGWVARSDRVRVEELLVRLDVELFLLRTAIDLEDQRRMLALIDGRDFESISQDVQLRLARRRRMFLALDLALSPRLTLERGFRCTT